MQKKLQKAESLAQVSLQVLAELGCYFYRGLKLLFTQHDSYTLTLRVPLALSQTSLGFFVSAVQIF